MRTFVALASVVAVVGVACASTAAAPAPTSLRVTYWEDGSKTNRTALWTLSCNPTRGTLERPAVACRKLATGGAKLFAPLPKNVVCTEIWGGPQKARVVGTVSGNRVWTVFTRSNGCNIGRWNAVSPWLLPPGGASS